MDTPITADIGMRLLVPVPDHATAAELIDSARAALGAVLGHHGLTGRLDFVHFSTRPCKAARLADHASDVSDGDTRLGAAHAEPLRGNPARDGTDERA